MTKTKSKVVNLLQKIRAGGVIYLYSIHGLVTALWAILCCFNLFGPKTTSRGRSLFAASSSFGLKALHVLFFLYKFSEADDPLCTAAQDTEKGD